jgi:proteasome accessory factor B
MEPLERLLNLVGLLLETTKPLTYEQIRAAMPEAYGQSDRESAKRMFERDKESLRHYDIPLEMEDVDVWGGEQGYRIPKDKYYLPEISFTPEELAALFVAAQSGGEDHTAEGAMRKLLYGADGGVLQAISGSALAAGTDAAGPADPLLVPDRQGRGCGARRGCVRHGVPGRTLVSGRQGPRSRRDPGVPTVTDHDRAGRRR